MRALYGYLSGHPAERVLYMDMDVCAAQNTDAQPGLSPKENSIAIV